MNHRIIAVMSCFFGICTTLQGQTSVWESWVRDFKQEQHIRGVEAAAASESKRGLEVLIELLDDPDPFVRRAVTKGLLRYGERAIDGLAILTNGADQAARASATNALINLLGSEDGQVAGAGLLTPQLERKILELTSQARCWQNVCLERWVRPTYPLLAQGQSIQGRVWVTFSVDRNGQPQNISAKGIPEIAEAAAAAAKGWRFAPNSAGNCHSLLFEFQMIDPPMEVRSAAVDMVFPRYVIVSAHKRPAQILYDRPSQ